jgi:hypothetical protein
MKREKAEKKIRKYLHDLHVTLWSDFDLHRPDGFERAVEWFLDQAVRAGLVHDKEPQGDSPPVESVPDLPVSFDSGFVTYKDPEDCVCEDGENYFIVSMDCPIHSPHAFPWRKSR